MITKLISQGGDNIYTTYIQHTDGHRNYYNDPAQRAHTVKTPRCTALRCAVWSCHDSIYDSSPGFVEMTIRTLIITFLPSQSLLCQP